MLYGLFITTITEIDGEAINLVTCSNNIKFLCDVGEALNNELYQSDREIYLGEYIGYHIKELRPTRKRKAVKFALDYIKSKHTLKLISEEVKHARKKNY